jgi:hypothetical protein
MNSTNIRFDSLSESEKVARLYNIIGHLNEGKASPEEMVLLRDFADKWASPRAMAKYGIALLEGRCTVKDEAQGLDYMGKAKNDSRCDAQILILLGDEYAKLGAGMILLALECYHKAAVLGDMSAIRICQYAQKEMTLPEAPTVA